ncbi:hypothetical protein RJT34_15500 [Clitoria ternatea]|uniref:Cyclotide n=1 Tax=Clitoria ternatea TaxID=43366 RepID=A0AAN9J6I0_CLITE
MKFCLYFFLFAFDVVYVCMKSNAKGLKKKHDKVCDMQDSLSTSFCYDQVLHAVYSLIIFHYRTILKS